MDEKAFKERVARLEQIGAALTKLPAEVRSQAFDILAPYAQSVSSVGEKKAKPPKNEGLDDSESDPEAARGKFFEAFDHDKPADNVKLVAAYHYGEHGSLPFTVEELKALADDVGITVPERIDMTVRAATEDGKRLFASAGRGLFKPTVHGEAYMKKQYSVKKGKKPKPPASE